MQPGMQQSGFGGPPGGAGFGPPPGGPMGAGAPGGSSGGMLGSIMGGSNDLQRGGFSVPGYEWQNQGGAPAAPQAQQPQPAGWGPPPGAAPQPSWGATAAQPQTAALPQTAAPPQTSTQPTLTADQYRALPERPVSPYQTPEAPATSTAAAPTAPTPATNATTTPAATASNPDFPSAAPAPPAPTSEQQTHALLLVRAMVSAASADGQIDDDERRAILDRLARSGATEAERTALEAEMKAPQQVTVLAAQVHSPELAEQFYAVSLLSMKIDTEAETGYARMLPLLLRLSDERAVAIEQKVGVSVPR